MFPNVYVTDTTAKITKQNHWKYTLKSVLL